MLLGSGVQNRFVSLESAKTVERPEIAALMSAAIVQDRAPLPTTAGGKLIIRSISAKQKPRRKPS